MKFSNKYDKNIVSVVHIYSVQASVLVLFLIYYILSFLFLSIFWNILVRFPCLTFFSKPRSTFGWHIKITITIVVLTVFSSVTLRYDSDVFCSSSIFICILKYSVHFWLYLQIVLTLLSLLCWNSHIFLALAEFLLNHMGN